jgi:MFS family permease
MQLKLYSFILFINSYISGLLVPVLSLLLIDKGASLSNLSIIMGIYSFTIITFELPTGIMADLIGRKKTFCVSLLLSLFYTLVILIGHGFWVLCIGIVLYGLNRALSSGSLEALFIDSYIKSFGKEKLNIITTRIHVLEALGLSAGALSGGIFPKISNEYITFLGTYDLNLIIRIILIVIVVLISFVFIKETYINEKEEKVTLKHHIQKSLNFVHENKTLKCIFISVFSTGFFLSSLEIYWQPHFISLMYDNNMMVLLGVMAFLYLAASVLGNIFSSKIINKFNPKKVYLIFRLILSFSLIVAALQTKLPLFILFYTLIYFTFGMANIAEGVILNSETLSEVRASILSVNSLIMQLGGLLGSLLNSFIIKYVSIPKLWIIAAVIMLITVIITCKMLLSYSSNNDNSGNFII